MKDPLSGGLRSTWRRGLLLAALLLPLAQARPARAGWRLPAGVTPRRYRLDLAPDLAALRLDGSEEIEVTLAAPARQIVLHAAGLTAIAAAAEAGGARQPATIAVDDVHQQVTLAFARALPAGAATLTVRWSAPLERDLAGLFVLDAGGRRFAFTHFEPSFARRVFPCFDEPALTARFRLRVRVPAADQALSNTPVARQVVDGAWRTVEFAETPPLPTYLVALAIGRFDVRGAEVGGVPVRLYTVPGRAGAAAPALAAVAQLLPRLGAYLGARYPFSKLDLVAVPDFAPGAMENAGLVFVREARLLVDGDDLAARREMELLVAHELAHQWLGDAVTLPWWDALWLNEALATYVARTVVAAADPSRPVWAELAQQEDDVLVRDALAATRPVAPRVTTPGEAAEAFDEITYVKGAAVVRMLARWVGERAFAAGLRRWLAASAGGPGDGAALWRAVGAAAGRPELGAVAARWIDEPGHPLVTVATRCTGRRLTATLTQVRDVDGAPAASRPWPIPLVIHVGDDTSAVLFAGRRWQLRAEGSGGCPRFAVDRAAAFLRLRRAGGLEPPLDGAASEAERVARLGDAWAEVRRGERSTPAFLRLGAELAARPSAIEIEALAGPLRFVADELVSADERAAFRRRVAAMLLPAWRAVGFVPRPGDDDETRLLRAALAEALGELARAPALLAEVDRRLPDCLGPHPSLPPELARVVVRLGAETGPAQRYDTYLSSLRAAATPERRTALLQLLPAFSSGALVRRTLELALAPSTAPSESLRLVAGELAGARDDGRRAAWRFFTRHYDALADKLPRIGYDAIIRAAGAFCDESGRRAVDSFFAAPDHRSAAERQTVRASEEEIGVCAAMRRRERPRLAAWLRGAAAP